MSIRTILFAVCGVGLIAAFPVEALGQCSSGRQGSAMMRARSIPSQGNALLQAQLTQLVLQQRQMQLQTLMQSQLQAQAQQQVLVAPRQQQEMRALESRISGSSDSALQRYTRSSNQRVRELASAELDRRKQQ